MDVAGEQLQSPQDGLGFWGRVRSLEFRQQRLGPFERVAEPPFSVGPFDGSVATFAGAAHGRALLPPRFRSLCANWPRFPRAPARSARGPSAGSARG